MFNNNKINNIINYLLNKFFNIQKIEKEEENNSNESYEENDWNQCNLNLDLNKTIFSLFKIPREIKKRILIFTNAKVDLIVHTRTEERKT